MGKLLTEDTRNTAFLIFCLDAIKFLICFLFFILLLIYSIAGHIPPGSDEWKLPMGLMKHLRESCL